MARCWSSTRVGGDAVLQLEQPVRVVVDVVLRRGRQPDQPRVEPVEDRLVLLVHRPVRLVDDDQVEVSRAEPPLVPGALLDQAHHRRVRADVTESYAVAALVDWSRRDAPALREAALTLRSDPDALPLAITLLDRAAEVAAAPPPSARHYLPPDASGYGSR